MKTLAVSVVLLLAPHGFAQVVAPASPKKFITRPLGNTASAGATIEQVRPEDSKTRYVTHLVLSEVRQWTSSDGKPLVGKLIAFEDLVAETPKGAAAPEPPTPPEHPTVVRGGKVRLLVNQKAFEVFLARLSAEDQTLVEQTRLAHAKKPESASP